MSQNSATADPQVMWSVVRSDGAIERLLFYDWTWSLRMIPAATGNDETREVMIPPWTAFEWWEVNAKNVLMPNELSFHAEFPNVFPIGPPDSDLMFEPKGYALVGVAGTETDWDWEGPMWRRKGYLFSHAPAMWLLISFSQHREASFWNDPDSKRLTDETAADWCVLNSVPLPQALANKSRIRVLSPDIAETLGVTETLGDGRPDEPDETEGISHKERALPGTTPKSADEVIQAARAKITTKQKLVFDYIIYKLTEQN